MKPAVVLQIGRAVIEPAQGGRIRLVSGRRGYPRRWLAWMSLLPAAFARSVSGIERPAKLARRAYPRRAKNAATPGVWALRAWAHRDSCSRVWFITRGPPCRRLRRGKAAGDLVVVRLPELVTQGPGLALPEGGAATSPGDGGGLEQRRFIVAWISRTRSTRLEGSVLEESSVITFWK